MFKMFRRIIHEAIMFIFSIGLLFYLLFYFFIDFLIDIFTEYRIAKSLITAQEWADNVIAEMVSKITEKLGDLWY